MSLATATEVLEEYSDGVWFIELAALSDPTLVLPTVASIFDIRETLGRLLRDALSGELRPKQLLLILDNCEHLVDACAALVAALLPVCADLRVLATSREVLGVPGESVWRVPSLSSPDPARPPPIDVLMRLRSHPPVRGTGGDRAPTFRADARECRCRCGHLPATRRDPAGD